jgi:outer membrane lipoprotein-sorting protein
MKLRHVLVLTCAVLLGAATSTQAQLGGRSGQPPGANPALAKVFGKNTSFSAKAQMKVMDGAGKEVMSGPVTYAMLEGSTYWGMDISAMKSAQIPPQAAASMKQMGMAEMVMVNKAGAKTGLLIYPGMKAYAEMPLPAEATAEAKSDIKTETVGEETVNGHKCKKNKVTITDGGKTQEVFTWNATDLKDFPVRVEMSDANNKVQMDYSDIKLEKPEAKLFEAPAGFTRYENVQALLQGEMMKRMGGAGGGFPPAPK